MKKLLFLITTLILTAIFCLSVSAQTDFSAYTQVENNDIGITDVATSVSGKTLFAQSVSGENYLFLPSNANTDAFILNFKTDAEHLFVMNDGQYGQDIIGAKSFNLKALAEYDKATMTYTMTLRSVKITSETLEYSDYTLKVMQSANINTMYISFEDSAYNRAWIDSSPNHTNDAGKMTTVKMYMVTPDGDKVYDGKLTSMKGRGNSSWLRPKKPYQIKLDKKTDLLSSGNSANKNKTWILIPNAIDKTMIKNPLAFDLGKYFGLDATPEYTFTDIYFDGIYYGTYLLCEKVQINDGRVEIADLEAAITTEDTAATAKGKNKYGYEYQYNPTSSVPEGTDITGGYLLEEDDAFYRAENSWFKTADGRTIVIKSPEYATKEMVEYISERFYEMIQAANSGSFADRNVSEYLDIPSFATLCLLNEYTFNVDYLCSSTYFFFPEEGNEKYEHKFYAGPVWDFDTSMGNRTDTPGHWAQDATYIHKIDKVYYRSDEMKAEISKQAAQLNDLYSLLYADEPTYVKDTFLKSISAYRAEIYDAAIMNYTLWPCDKTENTFCYPTYDENYDYAVNWMKSRHASVMPTLLSLGKQPDQTNCKHICHSENKFEQFIWKIQKFFCKLFKIKSERVCECNISHW